MGEADAHPHHHQVEDAHGRRLLVKHEPAEHLVGVRVRVRVKG